MESKSPSSNNYVSHRKVNKFLHSMCKSYRRMACRDGNYLRNAFYYQPDIALEVANRYLTHLLAGDPRSAELQDILRPSIAHIVQKEGFPIHKGMHTQMMENLEKASDVCQDLHKGLCNLSGIDTHYILESLIQQPHGQRKWTRILKGIHPDFQLGFSIMILESAEKRKRLETDKQLTFFHECKQKNMQHFLDFRICSSHCPSRRHRHYGPMGSSL
jgi:hypothetical protein